VLTHLTNSLYSKANPSNVKNIHFSELNLDLIYNVIIDSHEEEQVDIGSFIYIIFLIFLC
jgi:hypothetical protein